MTINPTNLNLLYQNAMKSATLENSWRFRIYSSPEGSRLKDLLLEALRFDDIWGEAQLQELKTNLQVILTYSRTILVAEPDVGYWPIQIDELSTQLNTKRNYLPAQLIQTIEKIINKLQISAAELTRRHSAEVLSEILKVSGSVLLVPETPSLGRHYSSWIDSLNLDQNVRVLANMGEINSLHFYNFELVVFPGAPNKYTKRSKFDIYLRALTLSGLTSKVTFVAPNWSSLRSDENFASRLFSGLELKRVPKLVLDIEANGAEPIEIHDEQVDFEEFDSNVKFDDFEAFEKGGSVPCRFISIGKNLVYPVEEDSKKVYVLAKNKFSSEWELTYKHPFDELEIGDILAACVGRSELQALRGRAAADMGEDFVKFEVGQENWKNLLKLKATEIGLTRFESELKAAGVQRHARAKHWWHPDAIQPGFASDFKAMLNYLGFSNDAAREVVALASMFDGYLIKAGRQAGLAITDNLGEVDIAKLDEKTSVEITLENFGDATYLLAPVLQISEEEIVCQPSQVRQVISLTTNGN